MIEAIKVWARKYKKGIIATCSIIAVIGTTVVLIINGKRVTIPLKELVDKTIPASPNAVKPIKTAIEAVGEITPQLVEDVIVEVDGMFKTFPRTEFIRQLPEGWHASAEKLSQATAMGITLKPGETIVKACMVTRHTA